MFRPTYLKTDIIIPISSNYYIIVLPLVISPNWELEFHVHVDKS